MRILLIEDEEQLSNALCNIFKENKYEVIAAYDGQQGLFYGTNERFDLIIIDIMLPKISGFEVLKAIRNKKITTPIMLLTALSSEYDKVKGLDYGADDYVTKPFSTEELLARIRALSRRKGDFVKEDVLIFEDLKLNLQTYEMYTDKKSITVSFKEFALLKYFLERPKIVISKEEILNKIWKTNEKLESNSIEVYMSFIRKKLIYIGTDVSITAIRGAGYRLEKLCSEN